MELQVEIDDKKLQKALKNVPDLLKEELMDAFDHIPKKFYKLFYTKQLKGPKPEKILAAPASRGLFGQFKKHMIFSRSALDMGVVMYTDSKVGSLHETGGTLTAKGGGHIAVPLSARSQMYTAAGRLKKKYKEPSSLKNLIKIKIHDKQFLVQTQKKSGEILPLYVLKNKIRIKPKLGFLKLWEGQLNVNIGILDKSVDKALARA